MYELPCTNHMMDEDEEEEVEVEVVVKQDPRNDLHSTGMSESARPD